MADPLSTAFSFLGAVGVLGQLFNGCMTAYSLFTSAANQPQDSGKLIVKIRIEEMRLSVWGREWGVSEGRLEGYLTGNDGGRYGGYGDGINEKMRELAIQILRELHRTITDFEKLKERYGFAGLESNTITSGQDRPALNGSSKLSSKLREGRDGLSMRARWIIGDKEKFQIFLDDLKAFNDGLEQLFPPDRVGMLRRSWTNGLLTGAQRDVGELGLLEEAGVGGGYGGLVEGAKLKRLRIDLDAGKVCHNEKGRKYKIDRQRLKLGEGKGRCMGVHHDDNSGGQVQVLVEWCAYDKSDVDERFNHIRRIDDLARMIHSASERHPDLHTIDCLGYTDDVKTSRYGLIYKAPQSSFSSLNALIASNDLRTPDLGDRFRLAHTLAISLWSLHSLDWLHKSVCSSNILFFPDAFSNAAVRATATAASVPDISYPYFVGFDSSRPAQLVDMSVASKNPSALDLHRHPSSLGTLDRKPYCKSFDIYSLGLVLLEIGLWKVLQTYHRPHYSAAKFKDRVVFSMLVPGLGSKTGGRYRDVVERCLTAKEDLTSLEAGQLMESIVATLETLRV
jgi:hypothetical protein